MIYGLQLRSLTYDCFKTGCNLSYNKEHDWLFDHVRYVVTIYKINWGMTRFLPRLVILTQRQSYNNLHYCSCDSRILRLPTIICTWSCKCHSKIYDLCTIACDPYRGHFLFMFKDRPAIVFDSETIRDHLV